MSLLKIMGSNLVTRGQLLCKEISDVNIWTWVAWAKKVAVLKQPQHHYFKGQIILKTCPKMSINNIYYQTLKHTCSEMIHA